MTAAAERSLPVRMRVRNNSSSASVDAMDVRIVRNAVAAVRSSNVRRNSSSVLRNSSPRRRKPRGSGREGAAGVAAAEIAEKNRFRIRTRVLRNSSNRVRRANRVLLARRRPRVRMPRERRRRVRKATDRNAAAVFAAAGAVVGAGRKALRRQRKGRARPTGSAHVVAEPWATNAAGRAG